MFPENIEFEEYESNGTMNSQVGKSFLFDFGMGEFIFNDGKVIPIKEVDVIKQWIIKVLKTEKHRFRIYEGTPYGVQLEDLIIGYIYNRGFLESEVKREITEALMMHDAIDSISQFKTQIEDSHLKVSFTVSLKDETFRMEVEV